MAAAETARLIASLELQDKNFTRGIRNVERGVNRVDKKLGAFSGFVNRNVGRALDSIALRATQAIGSGLEDLATLEDATTSVTGAIAQVGEGWSVTGEQIATWANEIEADTEAAFDDKAIVASAATLIRYGKVSEGNLRPALEVMTDLAAKTGDTESAASLLGKALADPAKAAGKLARQGIVLTKAQQKQIKAMVKVGDVAGAQTLLLEILSDTTEGAAKASAGPYRDALNRLGDAGEDLRKAFAVGLLPVIEEVSDVLTTELAKPETLNTLKGIGSALADTLRSVIKSARGLPWGAIGDSLKIAGAGAKAVLDAFLGLPPWIQTAVITGWGLNKLTGGALSGIFTGLASGLIKGVLGMNAGVVNINAGVVNGGGVPGVPGGKAGGKSPLGLGLKGPGGLLLGLTGVGLVAALASEFEDEIQGLASDLGRGWQDALGIEIPKIFPDDLEWPFGPKNTPSILPEIFGGNGLFGGNAPGTGGRKPGSTTGARPRGNEREVLGQMRQQTSELGLIKNATVTLSTSLPVEQQATKNAITNAKSIASRENQATKSSVERTAAANKAAIDNAKSVASRENAAQKASTERVKQQVSAAKTAVQVGARSTAGAATRAGSRAAAASSSGASRIVSAIWAARTIIQPTNVIEKYTTIVRTGGTSGSRNSGPLE